MSIRNASKRIYYALGMILVSPLLILFLLIKKKIIIILDVRRWSKIYNLNSNSDIVNLVFLLFKYKEFRNVYYYRIKKDNTLAEFLSYFFKILYSELHNLRIYPTICGLGLFICHGMCTIISARNIGENCFIHQQVTIGWKNGDYPTIGNNVHIMSGAKVIGEISIGDNTIIGANAVVVTNVPENCVVVGVPAYIIKRNGIKVKEKL